MRTLSNPNARFADDHGAADPITREAMAKVVDHTSYVRALVALCSSRLLMPIVASGDETDHPDPDRHAEMAAVQIVTDDGAHLLAFTGLDSLQAWQPGARPVPCTLDDLCATVQEAGADRLLIDCAGPTPLVVAGEALELFAQGYAVAEFEGGEFAWVKYDEVPVDPAAQQVAELEGVVDEMGRLIEQAEREAEAAEGDGESGQNPTG